MATYASVVDVELEWNRSVPADGLGHVNWLIDKAEGVAVGAIPNLQARIDGGLTTVDQVRHVVAAMVVRVLRNPDGKRSETAGDYSYELAPGSGAGSSGMYLASDERRLLSGRRQAMSMRLVDDALSQPLRKPPLGELDLYRDSVWEWRA